MKLDFQDYPTAEKIELQVKSWLKENSEFIRALHKIVIAIGVPIEKPYGYEHAIFNNFVVRHVRADAYQENVEFCTRTGKQHVANTLNVYVGDIQVVQASWQDDQMNFSLNSYFRPGDWIETAREMIFGGEKLLDASRKSKEEKQRFLLMELLNYDKDL